MNRALQQLSFAACRLLGLSQFRRELLELRRSIRKEREWYLLTLRAAEADLSNAYPVPPSLEDVRYKIAILEADAKDPCR